MKEILEVYDTASGQTINFFKSSLSFSTNTKQETREKIGEVLGVNVASRHVKYLGVPTKWGCSKKEVLGILRERNVWKLKGWKQSQLSYAGREVMIKVVVSAPSIHVMSCMKLPKGWCDEIQALVCQFWWGQRENERGIQWVSWDNMTEVQGRGGMGYQELQCFNDSLLTKTTWRIYSKPILCGQGFCKAFIIQMGTSLKLREDTDPHGFGVA